MKRKGFIGSSDIGTIMGLNPWKSPLMLWAEKTGQVETKDLSDNEAVEWGTRLESVVAEKFAQENNVKLMAYRKRYTHPEYDFLTCELDRLIVGTDEIVEVKTCNAWAYKDWKDPDQIPDHYICQVMFALGLSKRRVGHFAVLCGGQKYFGKRIEFDQEFYDSIVSRAVEFWKMVQDKTPPMAIGMDNVFIKEVHPSNDEEIQEAQELEDKIAYRQEISGQIGEMIKEKDKVEAEIKQRIGDHLGIKTEKYKVTWKAQKTTSIDTKKLKEDGLYDQYKNTGETRVLRVRKESDNGKSKRS